MASVPAQVVVDTKSAWASKINWTQAIGIGASVIAVLTANKINIPIEQQAALVLLIQTSQGLVTWIMKTWFTKTVTAASMTPSNP